MLWQVGGLAARAVLQVAVLALYSRLLSPEDFGLLAVGIVVVEACQTLSEAANAAPLVYGDSVHADALTEARRRAGAIGLVGALLTAASVWFAYPPGTPDETAVLVPLLLAFAAVIAAVLPLPLARLRREFAFGPLALADLGAYAVGFLAVGPLALFLLQPAPAFAGALLAYRGVHLWRVVRAAKDVAVDGRSTMPEQRRSLRAYRRHMVALSALNYTALRADYYLVGALLGITRLGIYERAYRFVDLTTNCFSGALDKVLFVSFARRRENPAQLGRALVQVLGVVSLVYVPLTVFLVLVFPQVRRLLLGPGWEAVDGVFLALAAGIPLRGLYKIVDAFMRGTGELKAALGAGAVYALGVVTLGGAGVRWGVAGVAVGVVAAMALKLLVNLFAAHRRTEFAVVDLIRSLAVGVGVGAGVAVGGVALRALVAPTQASTLVGAAACAAGGLVAGTGVLWLLRVSEPVLLIRRELGRLLPR